MKRVLQLKLYKKYPKIFKQQKLPMTKTCMCWGFECGDGWYWLIDHLCSQLQWDVDRNKRPQLEAVQVKEKFGTLRFYADGSDDYQEGMIALAEFMSASICEICGSTDKVKQTTGWITTLCPKCKKSRQETRTGNAATAVK